MWSTVWRAKHGVRKGILPRRCGSAKRLHRPRFAIATVLVLAITGCAPHHWEGDDMYGAADPPPSKTRPKGVTKTAAKIPLPSRTLLTPQAEPKCDDVKSATGSIKTANADPNRTLGSTDAANDAAKAVMPQSQSTTTAAAAPPPAAADAEAGLSLRIKLEYERECYRQAELRARGRLKQLQESVSTTIKAVEAQNR
jgi:hypothetical protein